jgi:uncharacterized coiled-coil protein SlyX
LAKLIKILAASVGGGLVLGAGIRLGEAIAAQNPGHSTAPGDKLAERLGALENRLLNLETGDPQAGESLAGDSSAAGHALSDSETGDAPALNEMSVRLRGELRGWLEESVAARMAEVEVRLKAESERSQKHLLDAFAESVQTRVIQRISSLEEEVAGQSAAMSELRACSLRTEASMQKLLGGLDRLIVNSPRPVDEATGSDPGESCAAEPAAAQPAAGLISEQRPRPRRWSIFG